MPYNPENTSRTKTENNGEIDKNAAEYSSDDLEGMDDAAHRATDLVEMAVKTKATNREVSYTGEGLRGRVADGNVEALFNNSVLEQVNMTIDNGDSKHVITVDDVETNPMLYIDGKPIKSEEIPSAQAVISAIHEMRRVASEENEKQSEVATEEDAETQDESEITGESETTEMPANESAEADAKLREQAALDATILEMKTPRNTVDNRAAVRHANDEINRRKVA